jgi:hypothetical protein
LGQKRFAWPGQLIQRVGPRGHRHDEGFSRPGYFGAVAVDPVHVGGDQAYAAGFAGAACRGRAQRDVEHPLEPLGRNDPPDTEGSSNILLVDHAVHQGDHAAERRRESAWRDARSHQVSELPG